MKGLTPHIPIFKYSIPRHVADVRCNMEDGSILS